MTVDYILTVFITIVTVVDPLGIIPVYLPIANKFSKEKHRSLVLKSVLIALVIALLFLIAGKILFYYLKIEFYSLYVVGGILLFIVGLQMIRSTPRKTISEDDLLDEIDEVAVFPLAVPMLSGPGTIATLLMFVSKSNDYLNYLLVLVVVTIAFGVAGIAMKYSEYILKILGKTGINILDRIMGIILCALAVQFMANAVKVFVSTLN